MTASEVVGHLEAVDAGAWMVPAFPVVSQLPGLGVRGVDSGVDTQLGNRT